MVDSILKCSATAGTHYALDFIIVALFKIFFCPYFNRDRQIVGRSGGSWLAAKKPLLETLQNMSQCGAFFCHCFRNGTAFDAVHQLFFKEPIQSIQQYATHLLGIGCFLANVKTESGNQFLETNIVFIGLTDSWINRQIFPLAWTSSIRVLRVFLPAHH